MSNEYGAQKVRLSLPSMETELVLFLLEQANKLANCAIYALRQSVIWFGRTSFHLEVVKNELQTELKENVHYNILHSQAGHACPYKNGQPYYNDYSWAKTDPQTKAAHF